MPKIDKYSLPLMKAGDYALQQIFLTLTVDMTGLVPPDCGGREQDAIAEQCSRHSFSFTSATIDQRSVLMRLKNPLKLPFPRNIYIFVACSIYQLCPNSEGPGGKVLSTSFVLLVQEMKPGGMFISHSHSRSDYLCRTIRSVLVAHGGRH
jgi:hypothetical protein